MANITDLATTLEGAVHETHEWGELTWLVNGALTPGTMMTAGTCLIQPGKSNPLHRHPNCDEVLVVTSGRCIKRIGDETVELGPGESVVIPRGMPHQATAIGDVPMTCVIALQLARPPIRVGGLTDRFVYQTSACPSLRGSDAAISAPVSRRTCIAPSLPAPPHAPITST